MTEWTQDAREELERYFDSVRSRIEASGADPSEVIDDIKRHIEADVAAAKLDVVTEQDVKRILGRMGLPEAEESDGTKWKCWRDRTAAIAQNHKGTALSTFVGLFGIALPLIALGIEMLTHICAETFFDPIPTALHEILVALVPVANILVLVAHTRGKTDHPRVLAFACGTAIGVSGYYTLLFLPLLPLSVFAIILYGMGFLSLSPLLSLVSTILCTVRVRRIPSTTPVTGFSRLKLGVALSILLLLAIGVPDAMTRIGMQMALSDSPATSERGIRLLRATGQGDYLLRACYVRPMKAASLMDFIFATADPIAPEQARKIYYRVTGKSFAAVPPPRLSGVRRWDPSNEFVFDPVQGERFVGGRLKGLSLASSRMDGSIDADAALGYLEWTFVFRNAFRWQREARAQILLPPGGVVSRLTLWIEGEEREAVFAGRGKVAKAYQQVVQWKRDPVLVTTCGPDRILMQCFPVPPDGGEMKVRIGITAPLLIESRQSGILPLPVLLDRNFTIPSDVKHSVWVEAKRPVAATREDLQAEHPNEALFAVRGSVPDAELTSARPQIRASREADVLDAWTPDPLNSSRVVRQAIEEVKPDLPARIVFAIDASRAMAGVMPAVAEALDQLPDGVEFRIVLASDTAVVFPDAATKDSRAASTSVVDRLRQVACVGGCDNVPALVRAWDIAAESEGGAVVWIHGPQPAAFQSVEDLLQRWDRRPSGPRLYDLQARNGPNCVVEKLDGVGAVTSIPYTGDLSADLKAFLSPDSRRLALRRERASREAAAIGPQMKETSAHLARLWADDEVRRMLKPGRKGGGEEAVKLASEYRIVTPVTGAVVLETERQYEQAGLTPPESGAVPTIPEPETWMLIGIALVALIWACYRGRPTCASA